MPKFPEITFRSTSVAAAGENKLLVVGDLTIKRVTRPVRLDVVLNKSTANQATGRTVVGFDATPTIKRSEFGLDMAVPAVSDEIALRISTEAKTPKKAG